VDADVLQVQLGGRGVEVLARRRRKRGDEIVRLDGVVECPVELDAVLVVAQVADEPPARLLGQLQRRRPERRERGFGEVGPRRLARRRGGRRRQRAVVVTVAPATTGDERDEDDQEDAPQGSLASTVRRAACDAS
jgi:hypothetical protein